ncbi:MAG: folylpolyglutamate synthase/dihydrofolate synthase family protein [Pyrinomonadaceae bacterium]
MDFSLEPTRKLLEALKNPHKNFPKIQIAGTNGKGSVCAFLDAICCSAHIKTGVYTSPHLVSITERVKISGKEVSEKDFARHTSLVRKICEDLVAKKELKKLPTFFEHITAITLSVFAEAEVKLAVLETGLGGRFDSVTAANAEIVGITPINYDHQSFLGNTLAEIAVEKAMIIRADTKVVAAEQPKEAERVILQRCAGFGITPNLADFPAEIVGETDGKSIVDFKTAKTEYRRILLNLRGRHQIENAKVAILIAEILQENFKITTENIIDGLQSATHKGRLEFYKNILFDGAHNASGAKALKDFLDKFTKKPITMIFSAMIDKDLSEIAKNLFPKAGKFIFTTPDNPRAMPSEDLAEFLPENFPRENVFIAPTVAEALKIVKEISSDEDLICVTGSLYLIGEVQKILDETSPNF